MNTKPVLIVRFPVQEGMNYHRYMEHISNQSVSEEYHLIFLKESNRDAVGFEVHNVTDHDPIKMDLLEKLIIDSFMDDEKI